MNTLLALLLLSQVGMSSHGVVDYTDVTAMPGLKVNYGFDATLEGGTLHVEGARVTNLPNQNGDYLGKGVAWTVNDPESVDLEFEVENNFAMINAQNRKAFTKPVATVLMLSKSGQRMGIFRLVVGKMKVRYDPGSKVINISKISGEAIDKTQKIPVTKEPFLLIVGMLTTTPGDRIDAKISGLPFGDPKTVSAGAAGDNIDEAIKRDDFETAANAIDEAVKRARADKKLDLIKYLVARKEFVDELSKEYDKVLAILDKGDEGPEANHVVGWYYCVKKGEWDKGLGMLAKSNVDTVSKAATADLSKPAAADAMVGVGDLWWKLSADKNSRDKDTLRQRAKYWYEQALPKLSGFTKLKLQRRLNE